MKKLLFVALLFATSIGMVNGQTILAHVNTQKVLDTMPSRKQAEKEIKDFRDKSIKELQDTQTKLQSDYQTLQQKKDGMSPTSYKFEEQRLMKKSQDFQQRQTELDKQIQQLSQELNAPILKEVQDAVAKVSKAKNIDYVIDQSSLLYSNGTDITNAVIKEVLKVEAANKAKAAAAKGN